MTNFKSQLSAKQLVFQELFIGMLIFIATLEMLNEYTAIVQISSFSFVLLSAFVLELLTFATLWLKKQVLESMKQKFGTGRKPLKILSVWPILFFSKFVFIWVLDLLFSDNIHIVGFLGILLVVAIVTGIQRLAYYIFELLGTKAEQFK